MHKKRERKHKKRLVINSTIDEEKLARLEAIRSKREQTMAMVKLRLMDKFNERSAIIRANMLEEEHEKQKNSRDELKSPIDKKIIKIREEMKKVMSAGIEKVHAAKILDEKVKYDVKSSTMTIDGRKYKIKKNVHMVGWGLESMMLGSTFEKIIGNNLKKGWLVVPRRTIARMSIYPEWFPRLDTRITYAEAESDATPDDICVRATKNIIDYCKKLKKNDILIVVLSAGSDDFLCLPRGTIAVREKMELLDRLRDAGATNREIDIVRTSLSDIRGGELGRSAYPAKVISLVMSDSGSSDLHLDLISGGPTSNNDAPSTALKSQKILEKYGIGVHELSKSIREVLSDPKKSSPSNVTEQSKMVDNNGRFKFVTNCCVASSEEAMAAMTTAAFRLGYLPINFTAVPSVGTVDDPPNVRRVTEEYTKIISRMLLAAENKITPTEMYESLKPSKIFDITEKNVMEIFPSKTKWARGLYVFVKSPAISVRPRAVKNDESSLENKTGTNQELALYFSLYWYLKVEQYPILRKYVVWFLGCASAGRDGNTNYGGAYGYENLAVDVYKRYKNVLSNLSDRSIDANVRRNEPETISFTTIPPDEVFDDDERAFYESILPDRVLATGNANRLFVNVNDGEDLLRIGNATGCTFTNVGDLHVFRIELRECSCDGLRPRNERHLLPP